MHTHTHPYILNFLYIKFKILNFIEKKIIIKKTKQNYNTYIYIKYIYIYYLFIFIYSFFVFKLL